MLMRVTLHSLEYCVLTTVMVPSHLSYPCSLSGGLVFAAMEATARSRLVVVHMKCKCRTSSGEMITLPSQKKKLAGGGIVLTLLQFYDAETN